MKIFGPRYRSGLLMIALSFSVFSVTVAFAGYQEGKKIFQEKCASCHPAFISMDRIKENFFKENNQLLHLKAPTVNMLANAIMRGPKKVGDPIDREMRQAGIEEYLESYLSHPTPDESVFSPKLLRYFKVAPHSVNLSDTERSDLAIFFMEYLKRHGEEETNVKRKIRGDLDLPSLLEEAQRSGKVLIIEVSSPTCHYCIRMDRQVFSDPEIREMLRKDFILADVNIDTTRLPPKLEKVYRHITPSFFFLTPEGKLLASYPGSWNKSDFVKILREHRSGGAAE